MGLMKFSPDLFQIFLFGLISAFAEFHIAAEEQKQAIVSIQNLFFFKKPAVDMGSFENFHCYFPQT